MNENSQPIEALDDVLTRVREVREEGKKLLCQVGDEVDVVTWVHDSSELVDGKTTHRGKVIGVEGEILTVCMPGRVVAGQHVAARTIKAERFPLLGKWIDCDCRFDWRVVTHPETWKGARIKMKTPHEIAEEAEHLNQRLWYNGHLGLDRESTDPEILKGADEHARELEKTYVGLLGPYTDYEWGMLHGKISALRWVLHGEWDDLDTY